MNKLSQFLINAFAICLSVFCSFSCGENPLLSEINERVDQVNGPVSVPVLTPSGGVYSVDQVVTMHTSTIGASIYYTLDGSTPTVSTLKYSAPIVLSGNGLGKTIKAIAVKQDRQNSTIISEYYQINYDMVAAPALDLEPGEYVGAQLVRISCATDGAIIRYTTNGSDPSASVGENYVDGIYIEQSMTLSVIALKDGMADSPVVKAVFVIKPPVPEGVIVEPQSSESIVLSWNETFGATRYKVLMDTSPVGSFSTVAYEGTARTALVNGLEGATKYWFRIGAGNADGFGPMSLAVSGTTFFAVYPEDGSRLPYSDPTLFWSGNGSGSYEIQIADAFEAVFSAAIIAHGDAKYLLEGLQEGDSRYWRVRQASTMPEGPAGQWNPIASFTVGNYAVGDVGPAGGIVIYDKSAYSSGWRYIEMSLPDRGNANFIVWGENGNIVPATSQDIGAGSLNTQYIINTLPVGSLSAARYCLDYTVPHPVDNNLVFDNWFLPSSDELLMAFSLKEILPELFPNEDWHWSSSVQESTTAIGTTFHNGYTDSQPRAAFAWVRPCRQF